MSDGAPDSRSTPKPDDPIDIVALSEADLPVLLDLIRALAGYERLSDHVVATVEDLRLSLFGPTPGAEAVLARVGSRPAGFALWFHNYSTFLGRPGLYLEDLFVLPQYRRRGIGRRLFARLAAIAVGRNCGRMEWSVLNWNVPAIQFYRAMGAEPLSDWTVFRLTEPALRRLGAQPWGLLGNSDTST